MSQNFTNYAFTESVRKEQEKYGSRASYGRMEEKAPDQNLVFQRELAHIESMDSFYMSTVGENGWPYVQFRGGPKGFLKVIDPATLGYADFRGNMQYISIGNINATKKAALILLDYPTKTRLKIWAETEILDPEKHPELQDKLVFSDYKAKVERLIIFHIKAFDWNCPQHITPKYTMEEMRGLYHANNDVKEYFLKE
ncbi:MAG: putative pyridoxine 5'-phosphate oxidase superfamily flavin-nucleotide-binding protein [Parvicellaceae bacterium]|jgi:predicted pyridoxine 5'-phosphate oxidase superfamily flavin-nucleotide-binding protein